MLPYSFIFRSLFLNNYIIAMAAASALSCLRSLRSKKKDLLIILLAALQCSQWYTQWRNKGILELGRLVQQMMEIRGFKMSVKTRWNESSISWVTPKKLKDAWWIFSETDLSRFDAHLKHFVKEEELISISAVVYFEGRVVAPINSAEHHMSLFNGHDEDFDVEALNDYMGIPLWCKLSEPKSSSTELFQTAMKVVLPDSFVLSLWRLQYDACLRWYRSTKNGRFLHISL